MIKVLIADDEPKIRRGIADAIDWDSLGMEICAFAENGLVAVDCVKAYQPDICLVDICMPVLNGLDFVQKIHEIAPSTICIVITGFDEFAYAQKAVSLGVFEYLLKPVNEKKLYNTLQCAAKTLKLQREKEQWILRAEKMLLHRREMLIESFLNELIEGVLTEEETREIAHFLQLQLPGTIAVVQLSIREESIAVQNSERDRQVLLFAVRNVMEELCAEVGITYFTVDACGRYCAIIDLKNKDGWIRLQSKIIHSIRMFSEIRVDIQMGTCDCLTEVPGLVEEWSQVEHCTVGSLTFDAKQYMELHFMDKELSASQIAKELKVNSSYLSRLFKQEMGMTITDCITKIRMREAMQLLGRTDLMIYEIADRVGYRSQHYFCVAFKKMLGVTPTEYKQMIQS